MMALRTTVLGMILVYSLWTEMALAGSSFLSPEQPRTQQRKVSPKPTPRVQRRDAEAFPDIHETEGDTNDIEIKLNVPFEIGMKISEEQYKDYGQILELFLEDIFAEDNKANHFNGCMKVKDLSDYLLNKKRLADIHLNHIYENQATH